MFLKSFTLELRNSTIAQMIAKPAKFILVKVCTNLVDDSVTALASDVVNNVEDLNGSVADVASNATNLADTVFSYMLPSVVG